MNWNGGRLSIQIDEDLIREVKKALDPFLRALRLSFQYEGDLGTNPLSNELLISKCPTIF
jgi:hypothetical protein